MADGALLLLCCYFWAYFASSITANVLVCGVLGCPDAFATWVQVMFWILIIALVAGAYYLWFLAFGALLLLPILPACLVAFSAQSVQDDDSSSVAIAALVLSCVGLFFWLLLACGLACIGIQIVHEQNEERRRLQ